MRVFGPIRVRLTAWYVGMLAVGLGLCGVGSWFGMRASAFDSIDEELKDRISGVEKSLKRQIATSSTRSRISCKESTGIPIAAS